MKLRVKVDPQLCIGAASCIVVDPAHFEIDTEGKAEVKTAEDQPMAGHELELEVDEAGKETLLHAAQSCPTQAIFIFDETGTQLFPA